MPYIMPYISNSVDLTVSEAIHYLDPSTARLAVAAFSNVDEDTDEGKGSDQRVT